ncbi:MAG: DUF3574 domain-containing protein, partial [Methylococcales bacterium]
SRVFPLIQRCCTRRKQDETLSLHSLVTQGPLSWDLVLFLDHRNDTCRESVMNPIRHIILSIALATGLVANAAWALDAAAHHSGPRYFNEQRFCKHRLHGELFSRTELFFGLSRAAPDPDITEAQFQGFIDTKVTPRFPDGLTLLSGIGQFKDSAGTTVQEGSKLLILLYPFNKQNNLAVEDIRTDYKQDFKQQSVLRLDERSCVSF